MSKADTWKFDVAWYAVGVTQYVYNDNSTTLETMLSHGFFDDTDGIIDSTSGLILLVAKDGKALTSINTRGPGGHINLEVMTRTGE